MESKELKRLDDTLDDNGRRELIYFLQSLTKDVEVPARATNEIPPCLTRDIRFLTL